MLKNEYFSGLKMMNRKASVALVVVIVVLALVILVMFLTNIALRECDNNRDCADNSYCGTDYECHEFPSQVVVKESNYIWAALIMGISLIATAYIFRSGKTNKI